MSWNDRELRERMNGPSTIDIDLARLAEFREHCVTGVMFEPPEPPDRTKIEKNDEAGDQ